MNKSLTHQKANKRIHEVEREKSERVKSREEEENKTREAFVQGKTRNPCVTWLAISCLSQTLKTLFQHLGVPNPIGRALRPQKGFL